MLKDSPPGAQGRAWHQRLTPTLLPLLAPPFLLTLLSTTSPSACLAFDAPAVREVLREFQSCLPFPALAVSIVKDGRVLLSEGYGHTTLDGNEAVTSSTRFGVASLSKSFAATLLVKVMEEDGRYNLSTKVREIFGDDFRFAEDLRTREATVEDVLSHKMAFSYHNRIRYDNNLTRANLKDRLKHMRSTDGFRTVFKYSNVMYGLATRMAEVIGGESWEDLIRRHLFEPLAMNRSTFSKDAASDTENTARPVISYFGTLKPVSPLLPVLWSELAGSGAVVSTADDMAKWMNFYLSKGQGWEGRQVMPESTMEQLYMPRTARNTPLLKYFRQPEVPVTFSLDVYCLGLITGFYRGYPILGHSGSSFGFRSLMTLVPSMKVGIFSVMTGKDSNYYKRGALHAYLLDKVMNVPSWLNTSTLCSFPYPWRTYNPSTRPPYDTGKGLAHNLSAYLGLYHNPAYGTLEVRRWQPSGRPDDGRESAALLTLFFGFGTWDLVPAESTSSLGEALYGKGRNVTAWNDRNPFVFHTPPSGGEVVVVISAPCFSKSDPPRFVRLGWASSGCRVCRVSSRLLLVMSVLPLFRM
ncbi:uncharacterized protein LOC143282529 [Babylonia areolata]|uniref:uncharacterized protein LOC143282529 n=1 Tax=Babylonia areolata TaxID=304850 RepID=UPI003FD537E6